MLWWLVVYAFEPGSGEVAEYAVVSMVVFY